MKLWQCPSEGCETVCGRRDRLTRHLKSQHSKWWQIVAAARLEEIADEIDLNISKGTFDALCTSYDMPRGFGAQPHGRRGETGSAKRTTL